jgi:hypothetical protein
MWCWSPNSPVWPCLWLYISTKLHDYEHRRSTCMPKEARSRTFWLWCLVSSLPHPAIPFSFLLWAVPLFISPLSLDLARFSRWFWRWIGKTNRSLKIWIPSSGLSRYSSNIFSFSVYFCCQILEISWIRFSGYVYNFNLVPLG